jgi:hypothetical protein
MASIDVDGQRNATRVAARRLQPDALCSEGIQPFELHLSGRMFFANDALTL